MSCLHLSIFCCKLSQNQVQLSTSSGNTIRPLRKHLQNRATRVSSSPISGKPIEITLTVHDWFSELWHPIFPLGTGVNSRGRVGITEYNDGDNANNHPSVLPKELTQTCPTKSANPLLTIGSNRRKKMAPTRA